MPSRTAALFRGVGAMIVMAFVLIALALVFFMVTAWIVNFAVNQVTGREPSPDFVALSASILTFGGLAGSIARGAVGAFAAAAQERRRPDGYEDGGHEVA